MGVVTTRRRAHPDLIDELFDEPHEFDFFQAVRLLERMQPADSFEDSPGRMSVGHDSDPGKEVVRFRALTSLAFPAGSIADLQQTADQENGHGEDSDSRSFETHNDAGSPPEMTVGFLGLTGPSGALPRHYTTTVIERCHSRHKDTTLRDYFDVFNHRTISLFYRAWRKYRFPFAYESQECDGGAATSDDIFTQALHCLTGIGLPSLQNRMQVPDESVTYFSGHFSNARPSVAALESMLNDQFGVTASVIQFVGQWLYLPVENQSSLPNQRHSEGRNLQLGVNAVVGSRVWDVQSRIRVRLDALSYSAFSEFMPWGAKLKPICDFVRLYVGPEVDFDIQPVLRRDEVPACRLRSDASAAPRLGWNTWMNSGEFSSHVDDARFRPEDVGVL